MTLTSAVLCGGALAGQTRGSPDVVVGIQPPAQAAAAGYTSLVFCEEFLDTSGIDMADTRQPGFNFYRHVPFGFPQTTELSVSNSILTFTGPGGTANYSLGSTCATTWPNWVGFDVTGGAYFEASIAFDPSIPAPGWPAFWSMADEHLWGGNNTGWIEADFFEKFYEDTTRYLSGGHWWAPSDTPAVSFLNVSGFNWQQFHTFGFLWVPGSRWQHYRDNVSTGSLRYSSYSFLANGDNQHWPVILGSDGHAMQVDWVRVWAAA
jgi:hypothetical protein